MLRINQPTNLPLTTPTQTVPYPTLPHPTLTYRTLPLPLLSYPTPPLLPYPIPPHLTLPYYPTLPYPTLTLPPPIPSPTLPHPSCSRVTLSCDSSYLFFFIIESLVFEQQILFMFDSAMQLQDLVPTGWGKGSKSRTYLNIFFQFSAFNFL